MASFDLVRDPVPASFAITLDAFGGWTFTSAATPTEWIFTGDVIMSDSGPAQNAIAVTPHNTNAIASARALWVGGAGNITLRTNDDDADVLISGIPAGTILPIRTRYVRATGTTATLIVALY